MLPSLPVSLIGRVAGSGFGSLHWSWRRGCRRVDRMRTAPRISRRLVGNIAKRILVSLVSGLLEFTLRWRGRRLRRRRRLDRLRENWPSQQKSQHGGGAKNFHSEAPF